jgi:antitoxin StbD
MTFRILADISASVAELKKNPMGTVAAGNGFAVAILNRNETAFYCVPATAYEAFMDKLDELKRIALASVGPAVTMTTTPVAEPSENEAAPAAVKQPNLSFGNSEPMRTIITISKSRRLGSDPRAGAPRREYANYYLTIDSPFYKFRFRCGNSAEKCAELLVKLRYIPQYSESNPMGGDLVGPPEVMDLVPIELHSTRAYSRVFLD